MHEGFVNFNAGTLARAWSRAASGRVWWSARVRTSGAAHPSWAPCPGVAGTSSASASGVCSVELWGRDLAWGRQRGGGRPLREAGTVVALPGGGRMAQGAGFERADEPPCSAATASPGRSKPSPGRTSRSASPPTCTPPSSGARLVRLQTSASSPVLELRDVTYRRDGQEIIRGVSFTVNRGERWASALAPTARARARSSGSAARSRHPTSGTVHVLGSQLGRVELQALRRMIGHVNPRHPLRSPLMVRDIVLTGLTGTIETTLRWQPTAAESQRADALISSLGLGAKAGQRWPVLSQGERGRVLIALGADLRAAAAAARRASPLASTSPPASSCSRRSTCSPTRTPTSPPCW